MKITSTKIASLLLIFAIVLFTFIGCQQVATTKDQPRMAVANDQSINSVIDVPDNSNTSSNIDSTIDSSSETSKSDSKNNPSQVTSQTTPSKTEASTDNTSAVMATIRQRYIDEENKKHAENLKKDNDTLAAEHKSLVDQITNYKPKSNSDNSSSESDEQLEYLKLKLRTNERNQVSWINAENERHQARIDEINKIYQ